MILFDDMPLIFEDDDCAADCLFDLGETQVGYGRYAVKRTNTASVLRVTGGPMEGPY